MLTNKRKHQLLLPLLLLALVFMAGLSAGAEPEASTPTTDQPEQGPAEAAEEAPASAGTEEETSSDETAPPRTIKEFTPTEKIEADSAVSFPIDI